MMTRGVFNQPPKRKDFRLPMKPFSGLVTCRTSWGVIFAFRFSFSFFFAQKRSDFFSDVFCCSLDCWRCPAGTW